MSQIFVNFEYQAEKLVYSVGGNTVAIFTNNAEKPLKVTSNRTGSKKS